MKSLVVAGLVCLVTEHRGLSALVGPVTTPGQFGVDGGRGLGRRPLPAARPAAFCSILARNMRTLVTV